MFNDCVGKFPVPLPGLIKMTFRNYLFFLFNPENRFAVIFFTTYKRFMSFIVLRTFV